MAPQKIPDRGAIAEKIRVRPRKMASTHLIAA
jgi:hypothetical protein